MTEVILHLSLIQGIGSATIRKIIGSFTSLSLLYTLSLKELQYNLPISAASAALIYQGLADKRLLENELLLCQRQGIQIVTVLDDTYPLLLKEIHIPPALLYVKGVLNKQDWLAVVGSRTADSYGFKRVQELVPALVQRGYGIVSGGAVGIDTAAHEAVLSAGGRTIAVLGSGLLKPYPARNKQLFERIQERGGAVISSFSLLTEPKAGFFPVRNRIIAGLARGCLVVQASEKSGALITAYQALEQGREVGAVPGSVDNPLTVGCHNLIAQGDHLIASVNDLDLML